MQREQKEEKQVDKKRLSLILNSNRQPQSNERLNDKSQYKSRFITKNMPFTVKIY